MQKTHHNFLYPLKLSLHNNQTFEFCDVNLGIKKMKKIIFAILFITSSAFNISAQDSESDLRTKLQFGLKFGTNYSNVFNAKGEDFKADPKFGIVTSVFLKVPFGKYIGFQPELLFSQKRFKSSGMLVSSAYRYSSTTSYIDSPLFVSVKPCGLTTLLAGSQHSYLLLEKDLFTNGNLTVDQ